MQRRRPLLIPRKKEKEQNSHIPISNAAVVRLFLFSVLILILSTTAFAVALRRWVNDGLARQRIASERHVIQLTDLKLQGITYLEQTAAFQKQQLMDLNDTLTALKERIVQSSSTLQGINVTVLQQEVNTINATLMTANTTYDIAITALELELMKKLSVAVPPGPVTVLATGVCNVVGSVNSSTVGYRYQHFANPASGIDFYHYLFLPLGAKIGIGTGPLSIEGCVPPIYQGSEPARETPLYQAQLDQFTGGPRFVSIRAGAGKMQLFPPDSQTEPQVVGWTREWAHLVTFF